ncbi:MAG: SH3 domain-containing protein [Rhodobacteraceae bacterium]|nr:SH3 domain-containing protein [Paracoccaceae bacterium]
MGGKRRIGLAAVLAAALAVGAVQAQEARGPVTNLPLPRFVSLKTGEGNARRGPGLTHAVDWVFTRRDMPLRVTAEHEHWRRVEDRDGAGGWVHYALLSGVRTAIVETDMVELRAQPDSRAPEVARAEAGVVARLIECRGDWCRIGAAGLRGWVPRAALWGVAPGETIR